MSRIVRDRGSVGRRIWRRRARRRSEGTGDPVDPDLPPFAPPTDEPPPESDAPIGTRVRPGFFSALTSSLKERLFGGHPSGSSDARAGSRTREEEPGYLATDPVGEVLAVPRGPSRLDAFERALTTATPGHAMHKDLALAFFRELSTLAEHAGVDLALLEDRVDACAQALLAAGEDERAGSLFLRMGARHRAVEVFVKAGAVEDLEEAYAQIQWEEGGAKQDARLAFERFEALFVVGMREAALMSLERAVKLWGDNPVFNEVYHSFLSRIGVAHKKLFRAGRHELLVTSKWPLVIGRGEEAAVRLASPLLSRAHVQIVLESGVALVRDMDSKGGTRVDEFALERTAALKEKGTIDMGGVVVRYERRPDAVLLVPALHPERMTWAITAPQSTLPAPDGAPASAASPNTLRVDAAGRALLLRGGTLNDERVPRDTLLLEGDRVGPWTLGRL